jgi:hypothetical protein
MHKAFTDLYLGFGVVVMVWIFLSAFAVRSLAG